MTGIMMNLSLALTCVPYPLVAPIHPKAVITILEPAAVDLWLCGSDDEIVKLQKLYNTERMTVRGPVFPTRMKGR